MSDQTDEVIAERVSACWRSASARRVDFMEALPEH